MSDQLSGLRERFRAIQDELEAEARRQQAQWHYNLHRNRIRFEDHAREAHRRVKRSIARFLAESSLPNLLTAPIIYSLAVPLLIADAWITAYQYVCFPIYRIPLVRRRDYLVFDRGRLGYLNAIEKANCVYCEYANGLFAYLREVSARTEQYWCPIKHARRVRDPHLHYPLFVDYGDAEGFHRRLPMLRETWPGRPAPDAHPRACDPPEEKR